MRNHVVLVKTRQKARWQKRNADHGGKGEHRAEGKARSAVPTDEAEAPTMQLARYSDESRIGTRDAA